MRVVPVVQSNHWNEVDRVWLTRPAFPGMERKIEGFNSVVNIYKPYDNVI